MSRTTRSHMTNSNYREARKGPLYARRRGGVKAETLVSDGWFEIIHDVIVPVLRKELPGGKDRPERWGARNVRGGMLMSPSSTGLYRDDIRPGDRRTKRAIKRSERQKARNDINDQI